MYTHIYEYIDKLTHTFTDTHTQRQMYERERERELTFSQQSPGPLCISRDLPQGPWSCSPLPFQTMDNQGNTGSACSQSTYCIGSLKI